MAERIGPFIADMISIRQNFGPPKEKENGDLNFEALAAAIEQDFHARRIRTINAREVMPDSWAVIIKIFIREYDLRRMEEGKE